MKLFLKGERCLTKKCAIEPMITAGEAEVYIHDDDWSISTVDHSLAAHFEHTVAVTAEGPRVLTKAAGVLVP